MNSRILLFAGTTEGRELARFLDRQGKSCLICVATEYGETLIDRETTIHEIHAGRLDERQMEELMRRRQISHVIDATHPYAVEATEAIRLSSGKAGCRYYRVLREESGELLPDGQDIVEVETVEEAVRYLSGTEGAVLAATGSKELFRYTALSDWKERVYARVLSTRSSVETATELGFEGSHLICMQGPFSEEMNLATLRQTGARCMVTKESGKTGGFPEKARAAKKAGAVLVVVGRPPQEEGCNLAQMKEELLRLSACPAGEDIRKTAEHCAGEESRKSDGHCAGREGQQGCCTHSAGEGGNDGEKQRLVTLIGIGMGTREGMTGEARQACEEADVLIGARRMLDCAGIPGKAEYAAYLADEIAAYVQEHQEMKRTAVLLSGDVGFYSGAKKLLEKLEHQDVEIRICCGISSVQYLCAKLHMAWEDVKLVSRHGRNQDAVAAVRTHRRTFVLVGRRESFAGLCGDLIRFGFGDVTMYAGCCLSYPDERILKGTPIQLQSAQTGDLCAVLIENEHPVRRTVHGLPDEAFTRGKVPMTKSEVRSISLSKLRLEADSVAWDIGAGTGSIAIEMALAAPEGHVYAIEKSPEAAELIRQNQVRMAASNLTVTEAQAPEGLEMLPSPTHAFVGGSSGNLRPILETLLRKNPVVRIVINAISLETLREAMDCLRELPLKDQEIVCVNISRSKEIGRYHMMTGMNPVYVISAVGEEGADEHPGTSGQK